MRLNFCRTISYGMNYFYCYKVYKSVEYIRIIYLIYRLILSLVYMYMIIKDNPIIAVDILEGYTLNMNNNDDSELWRWVEIKHGGGGPPGGPGGPWGPWGPDPTNIDFVPEEENSKKRFRLKPYQNGPGRIKGENEYSVVVKDSVRGKKVKIHPENYHNVYSHNIDSKKRVYNEDDLSWGYHDPEDHCTVTFPDGTTCTGNKYSTFRLLIVQRWNMYKFQLVGLNYPEWYKNHFSQFKTQPNPTPKQIKIKDLLN